MMKGIWIGALQVLIPKYDVEQVLAAIRDLPADLLPSRADHLRLAAQPSRASTEFGLEKVRTFNTGGAPCPVEVIDQFERTFGRTAERRLRAVGSLAGHAHDAAARRPQARHDRPAAARHRHEDRRSRDRDARAAGRRGRRAVHLRSAGDEGLLESAGRIGRRRCARTQTAGPGCTPATSPRWTRTASRQSSSARRT